jgi:hypothetical protein
MPPFGEPGVCPTIALFSSTTNHSPIGGPFSTAWLRLRKRMAEALHMLSTRKRAMTEKCRKLL